VNEHCAFYHAVTKPEELTFLIYIWNSLCCHQKTVPGNEKAVKEVHGHPYHSPSYVRVYAVVWEYSEGQTYRQTDTQTSVTNIHFASAAPHAKCNNSDNF